MNYRRWMQLMFKIYVMGLSGSNRPLNYEDYEQWGALEFQKQIA